MDYQLKSLAGASALALATTALPADANAAGPGNYQGFFLGVHIGYGQADFKGIFDNTDPPGLSLNGINPDGFLGGVNLGWNHVELVDDPNIQGYLFGIIGDVSFMDWKDSVSNAQPLTIAAEVDFMGSVRARAGIITNDILFYLTAGVGFIKGKYDLDNDSSNIYQNLNFSDVGPVIGAGVEFGAFDFGHFRIEGLYYFFNDRTDLSTAIGTGDPGDFIKLDDAFTITFGVSLQLDKLFQTAN